MTTESAGRPEAPRAVSATACTAVTLHMTDGEAYTVLLPAVMPARDEVRRYLSEGIGLQVGPGRETFYPAHSIVKVTVGCPPAG